MRFEKGGGRRQIARGGRRGFRDIGKEEVRGEERTGLRGTGRQENRGDWF